MPLVDTHCHLSFPPLSDDPAGVLARARGRGVTRVVVPAYDLASWPGVERIAREHAGVYPALGLHPWASAEPIDLDELARRLQASGAVAVGEIGLDFQIEPCDPERQVAVLEGQLEVARRLDLPVLLHCRGAFDALFAVLGAQPGAVRGVIHAFSRGPELARRFLERGLFVAFGGAVTRPGARRAHRAAEVVPPDRLLTETDAPSIGLHGVAPDQVEPHHVADIVAALARIRNETEDEVARRTWENAGVLFPFRDVP